MKGVVYVSVGLLVWVMYVAKVGGQDDTDWMDSKWKGKGYLKHITWLHIDPYVEAVWQMEAGRMTSTMCTGDKLACFKRLPGCRYLLFYVHPFTVEAYNVLRKYIATCSTKTKAGWNVDALPEKLEEFYDLGATGIEVLFNMGVDPYNYTEMFMCVQEKFNNVAAFKDCINM